MFVRLASWRGTTSKASRRHTPLFSDTSSPRARAKHSPSARVSLAVRDVSGWRSSEGSSWRHRKHGTCCALIGLRSSASLTPKAPARARRSSAPKSRVSCGAEGRNQWQSMAINVHHQGPSSVAIISGRHQGPSSVAFISGRHQGPSSVASISGGHQGPSSVAFISGGHQGPSSVAFISARHQGPASVEHSSVAVIRGHRRPAMRACVDRTTQKRECARRYWKASGLPSAIEGIASIVKHIMSGQ